MSKLVLNISHRSKCTTHSNLQKGLNKAVSRAKSKTPDKANDCSVVFNVQQPTAEPLLNIADYFCWAIQRVFERGETRYYDYISDQVAIVQDLYDFEKWKSRGNYYNRQKKLSSDNCLKNKKKAHHCTKKDTLQRREADLHATQAKVNINTK